MPNYQNFTELRTRLERMRARMGTAQDALQTADYQLHMLVTEISPLDRALASEILEQVSGIEQANMHTDLEDFIQEHEEEEETRERKLAGEAELARRSWMRRNQAMGRDSMYWDFAEGRIVAPTMTDQQWLALERFEEQKERDDYWNEEFRVRHEKEFPETEEPDLSGPRKDYADPMEDEAYVDHLIQEQEEREFQEEQEQGVVTQEQIDRFAPSWAAFRANEEAERDIQAKADVAMTAWRYREQMLGEKSEYYNPTEGRIISPMLTNNGWIALEQAAVDAWVQEQENLAAQAAKARQEQEDQEQEHTALGQAVMAARIRNRIIQEDAELMRRLRSVLQDILNI